MGQPRETCVSSNLVRDLPLDERPRERLLRNGSASLSDTELVSILLRSGRPGASSIDLARDLLEELGGLAGLAGLCAKSLRRPGVHDAKASVLLAAVEVGRRLARARLPHRRPMDRPEDVASYLALRYQQRDQEVMGALYIDTRQRLMGEEEFYRGTINRCAAEPRALLKAGLLRNAAGILVFHTHPSGDPSPSAEDLAFTRRLAEAGDVVGVRLVDHLILGTGNAWVSLRQRGAW